MNDDQIPVLVGCAQITQRETDPLAARSPLELMSDVAKAAATDAGPGSALLQSLDTVAVVRSFSDTSWRFTCPFGQYANPPRSLAQRIGAQSAKQLIYTYPGGNMPQYLLNRLSEQVVRGKVGAALLCGAEALATQKTAQRAGIELDWSDDPGGEFQHSGIDKRGWSDVEDAHGMRGAIFAYPLFENAIRGHLGRTVDEHQRALGEVLAQFATVAAANPLADRRDGFSASDISTPGPANPYIGFPYTRLMNANAFIDQGAAVVLTSVGMAKRLGIERDRWVFLHGCADAHDHWFISDRRDLHSSPAIAKVCEKTFEMAGCDLDDIGAIDLYSCFTSAVQIACEEIGLALDDPRKLTITGGLPYFGGPGNNYVTHAIAQMMERARSEPGMRGLVTANGNYVTKHSAGIYSTEPAPQPFAPQDPATYQSELDGGERTPFTALGDGPATVETYTVMHDRSGPSQAILFARLEDGTRVIANTAAGDQALLESMVADDYLGVKGRVRTDGVRNTFAPS